MERAEHMRESNQTGKVVAISISKEKGTVKTNVPEANIKENFGLVGDAHAGSPVRQVSLLAMESIARFKTQKSDVNPGDFAENITTEGIDLDALQIGDKLNIGKEAVLEISQKGKTCHKGCNIMQQVGDCIMPREGVFARVIRGGKIKVGDMIKIATADSADKNG